MSKPNTPLVRGADCTALAKKRSELVKLWGDGGIDDQRHALVLVLRQRHRQLAIDRLKRALLKKRNDRGLAGFIEEIAVGSLSNVAMRVLNGEPMRRQDLAEVLTAFQLFDAVDELERPGEN